MRSGRAESLEAGIWGKQPGFASSSVYFLPSQDVKCMGWSLVSPTMLVETEDHFHHVLPAMMGCVPGSRKPKQASVPLSCLSQVLVKVIRKVDKTGKVTGHDHRWMRELGWWEKSRSPRHVGPDPPSSQVCIF